MSNNIINLPFTSSHAFIIGIDNYQHVSSLKTAINDAKVLAEKLSGEMHGYTVHPPLLNATLADLMNLIEKEIPTKVNEEDRVLFYFAGHGIAVEDDSHSDGYIVPVDAVPGDFSSLIPMSLLRQSLNNLSCKHGLLILDCCYSGAFKWSSGFRDVLFDLPDIIYEQRLLQYAQDPAWQVITSSSSDQKANDFLPELPAGEEVEHQKYEGLHSPFALAFFDALDGDADVVPKGQGDGVITGTELYTYLRDRVEDHTTENAKRQTPAYFALEKHDKGQYIFLYPHRLNLPAKPDRSPFKGLEPYTETEGYLFFGRRTVISDLIKKLEEHSLVVLTGKAGGGKTSLVQAGVVPALKKKDWNIVTVIENDAQISLEQQLDTVAEQMIHDQKNLLIIDHYERKTLKLSEEEIARLESRLFFYLKEYENLTILLSLRMDQERKGNDGSLTSLWEEGRFELPDPGTMEFREIIIKPTLQEILFFEPDTLIEKMIDDIKAANLPLPLVSLTLSKLYDGYDQSSRQDRALIEADYDNFGGIIGALAKQVDDFYLSLKIEDKNVMRRLFLRMVYAKENENHVQRVFAEDLDFSDEDENNRVKSIAEQLVNRRILSTNLDVEGKVFFELAHPGLLQKWQRFETWVDRESANLETMYKLKLQVNELRDSIKKNPVALEHMQGLLKGGIVSTRELLDFLKIRQIKVFQLLWDQNPALDGLRTRLLEKQNFFNADEEGFIKASFAYRERRKRLARGFQYGISIILFIAFLVSQFYYRQAEINRKEAIKQKNVAITNEQKARNRLKEIYYKDYLKILERASNYENYGANQYARTEYDFAQQYLNDPKISEDTFIYVNPPNENKLIPKEDLLKEVIKKHDSIKNIISANPQ